MVLFVGPCVLACLVVRVCMRISEREKEKDRETNGSRTVSQVRACPCLVACT